MARQAKLRKKKVGKSTYWFTKAGGDTYLGNIADVSHEDAKKLFADRLLRICNDQSFRKTQGMTAGELMDLFLAWVANHRSKQTYTTRKIYCCRFAGFRAGERKVSIENLPANRIKASDLEAWLASLKKKGLKDQTRLHAETSVRHCWNWATKHPSPTPYLQPSYRPFSAVEKIQVPNKPLTEDDLLHDEEISVIFKAAALDPNQFRRHGLNATVADTSADQLHSQEGQVGCLADLLRCYYATGARTDELASCLVEDCLVRTKQVILGKHKRSRTQRIKSCRQVTLNANARAIFSQNCNGKQPNDHIFLNGNGRPWTVRTLAKRFERVKQVAAALKMGTIRAAITIYDFRHLWISEALMAQGNDIATVARMAGTSISMIERVYGHFRNQHLQDAQARVDQLRTQRGR